MLHNRIDELLNYNCWLASDDVRFIVTGLGFGAKKNNKLIKEIMDPYNYYGYPGETNVNHHHMKVLKRVEKNQIEIK